MLFHKLPDWDYLVDNRMMLRADVTCTNARNIVPADTGAALEPKTDAVNWKTGGVTTLRRETLL